MKRFLSWMLIVFLMTTALVGCAKKDEASQGEDKTVKTEKPKVEGYNPLSDIRVRQAIAYAINTEEITSGLLDGKALPANSLIENGPWKPKDLNMYEYNPDKARELLKEAGWDSNYELDVTYYYSDQETVDLMTLIQAYLADVGIKMTFRQFTGDVAAQLFAKPENVVNGPSAADWDLAYGAIASLTLSEFFNRFTSDSSLNASTPADDKLDSLYDATLVADIDKQKYAYHELARYENEKLYWLPLYYQQLFLLQSDRVDRKGVPYGNEQFAYDWRIIDWDIKPNDEGQKVLYSNSGPIEFFSVPHVNPAVTMSNKLLFDRLIISDGNLTPKKGQLAESYSISSDGLEVKMVIRQGVKWHDGVDFTTDDVVFSINHYKKASVTNALAKKAFESISDIEVKGNEIIFKLSEVNPDILYAFAQWPPLPKHLLEDADPAQIQQSSFWQHPVGTGPFKIDEVSMNDYCVLVRNPDYWDITGTGNIEKIHLSPSGDSDDNIVVNAKAGKIDYSFTKAAQDVNEIEKIDFMKVIPTDIRYTRMFYINKFPKK